MTGELRLVRPLPVPRAELWKACATTEGLEGWCADSVTGLLAPGGRIRLSWPGLGAALDLDVESMVPEQRVVLSDASSRVTLALDGEGLALTHEGLDDADDIDGFRSSWQLGLSLLAHGTAVHPGAARRPKWFSRSVSSTAHLVHLCLTEPLAVATWLGKPAAKFVEGSSYGVDLAGGGKMTGRVLSLVDSHDVALSVREQNDSVVAFRTFPSPKTEKERLVAICWSRFGPPRPEEMHFERALSDSLERLVALLKRSGAA